MTRLFAAASASALALALAACGETPPADEAPAPAANGEAAPAADPAPEPQPAPEPEVAEENPTVAEARACEGGDDGFPEWAAEERDEDEAPADFNLRQAEAFLEANTGETCVFTLPSGLQFRIDEAAGDNARTPGRGELVEVHYEGRLLDGTVFDSSFERGAPAVFPSDRLIPGWVEALGQIREGETWTLFLHPDLAYGEQGTPGGPIGPNSALIFRMELLGLPQRDANGE